MRTITATEFARNLRQVLDRLATEFAAIADLHKNGAAFFRISLT